MSRIGKLPVPLPSGVQAKAVPGGVEVKGPKGTLATGLPAGISMEIRDGEIRFGRSDDSRESRALHGLARALAANLVTGVTSGFKKGLEIQGVGYRASVSGGKLNLLLGYSHPVPMPIPKGLSVSVDGGGTQIVVEGIDKQLVGQFAADVRAQRPPEPYKGKGVRYAGEHVRRKVGKTGAA
jgi:large subunit ribosomal protein L6